MSLLAKTLVLVALACPLATATDCSGAACHDETSLLQVKEVVQHGNERIPNEGDDWSNPITHWKAISDSEPDDLDSGEVTKAFSANAKHTEDSIESKAARRIVFANKVREERKVEHNRAANEVAADKARLAKAEATEKTAIAETKRIRQEVMDAAAGKVKNAKENAEAHHLKAAQAERAAALGRRVGAIDGKDAAAHAWADYRSEVKSEEAEAAAAASAARAAKQEAAKRAAVHKRTEELAEQDDAWAARVHRSAEAAKARADALAAVQEERIEGAEGMRNRITSVNADFAGRQYEFQELADQKKIDKSAKGHFPAGAWPVGP